mmetsp:Transcript_108716/g.307502  ORF Transcript_108716/g.307502 Transcript_108716/m.307502 type:complete len:203 (-) Transcript_108716:923-1531(-)
MGAAVLLVAAASAHVSLRLRQLRGFGEETVCVSGPVRAKGVHGRALLGEVRLRDGPALVPHVLGQVPEGCERGLVGAHVVQRGGGVRALLDEVLACCAEELLDVALRLDPLALLLDFLLLAGLLHVLQVPQLRLLLLVPRVLLRRAELPAALQLLGPHAPDLSVHMCPMNPRGGRLHLDVVNVDLAAGLVQGTLLQRELVQL